MAQCAHESDQCVEVTAMTRDLRVALFADAYFDYSRELARDLAGHVELTTIHPLAWGERVAQRPIDAREISFEHTRMRDPRTIIQAFRLVQAISELHVDLLHVQATNNPWINLALRSVRVPFPIVQTVHDVVRHPGDRVTPRFGNRSARSWSDRVDHFIVHTEGLGRQLEKGWGISDACWSVVPHGELGSCYRDHRRRGEGPVEREKNTVLFFGRVWPYKGLDVLVDALTLFGPDRSTRLVVAGRGEPIAPYVARLPAHIEVDVLDGYVDHTTTLRLFEQATVVCLPYREASQSGVAALAVGLGVPIVASDVGGIGESLRSGLDAILVPPSDPSALAAALAQLLDEPARRVAMSRHQEERASTDLSWSQIAEKTVCVYRSVLQ